MIFAAGIGSRLKPFTDSHPKALAPVCGVPALERVLIRVRDAGIKKVVVNVHHFASQIIEFLEHNSFFGLDVTISDETGRLLDTGGGLLKAEELLMGSEPILLHNADIITDASISDMKQSHLSHGSDVTLLVSSRSSSRMLYFSQSNLLQGWKNLNSGQQIPVSVNLENYISMAFGGVHIVSPDIFKLLRRYEKEIAGEGNPFSIMPFYLWAINQLAIYGWCPPSPFRWFDIGTPEKLKAAGIAFCQA
ncbi:MAG: NTP transferase domain-containing protein [Bacteroidales bacterium]|nr:NTP transferase domain-containing protein [Bacteroidales bacterium]